LSTPAPPSVTPPPLIVAHIQPVVLDHPTTSAVETAGHRRRGFRNTIKNVFRR